MNGWHSGWRFLARRRAAVARLAGWSVVETAHTFAVGYAPARALDAGFLADRPAVGLLWLAVAALAVVVGAYGTGRTYGGVAALTEPLRDALVRRVVDRALRTPEGNGAALSRLTHQVEIARDTFAGLVMVSRSFVFTAVGALTGLFLLAPVLLLFVVPPLLLGLGLFVAALRPLARRQEAYLAADEALALSLGEVCEGLRDVTAAGAERAVAHDAGARVDEARRAATALARWTVARATALAVAGRLPMVPLLAATPWLLAHDVTPGALVGALTYLTQSLLPALHQLVHGLATSGSRLTVVLRRLTGTGSPSHRGKGAYGRRRPRTGGGRHRRPRKPAPPPTAAPAPPPTAAPAPSPLPAPPPAGHDTAQVAPAVAFHDVTFGYGLHAEPVVHGLDLVLPAGARLVVVGPSGVGKSTVAGLLAGVLVPWSGSVRVAGLPATAQGREARRVVVPQEAYVFSGTVGENLRYLCGDTPGDAAVLDAARTIGAGPLLKRLGGLAAPLDPARLSAGERQLIALTRAYLAPAPLAVLDEAACHLDPAAEARAERAFAARPGGTLVVVAHRTGSARRADRVLLMDGPRTALGTHDELMRRSALYRALMGDGGAGRRFLRPTRPPAICGLRRPGSAPRSCG
ncbi:hypothetical protein GCM10010218_14090 [Streptomyces mashuensis]|uniref:ABC transporter ATP-binding protein n=1 Tax=Streptomyces mashuensis TaxID=33904 RepID=A0A919AZF6_9ACTN|nr:ABC transporter ATP-binding protein [Streptomyces mashuensis]GHF34120.1 hypothetical protein GCM10010218_14090 [Streptomyces mashuensis]